MELRVLGHLAWKPHGVSFGDLRGAIMPTSQTSSNAGRDSASVDQQRERGFDVDVDKHNGEDGNSPEHGKNDVCKAD